MIRFAILLGFAFMFFLLHYTGDINKYINMKYSYLSISAIVLLAFLSLYDFVRGYRQDLAAEKRAAEEKMRREREAEAGAAGDGERDRLRDCGPDSVRGHQHGHQGHQEHDHAGHGHHGREHDHDHGAFGHSHEPSSKWKRYAGYAILLFPIFTGIFLPIKTLDSSFVAAKGFSFPTLEQDVKNNPGFHQFLRPDTSVFYSKEGYDAVKSKEKNEFAAQSEVVLNDDNFMKGMEALYNYPSSFMGKAISFEGFAYKGRQVDGDHYFVFRFGFIHCVADSGVFGMLADFPDGTELKNDDWVSVKGKLTWEYYQPLKATIPVLQVSSWSRIDAPKEPYVYRNF